MGRADHIEGLRVLATLWVLTAHFCHNDATTGFSDPVSPPNDALTRVSTIYFRGTMSPVKIFTVLSGFVMHWAYGSKAFYEEGFGSLMKFYGKRLDRVMFTFYLTLTVALINKYNPGFGITAGPQVVGDGIWNSSNTIAADKLAVDARETFLLVRQWIPENLQATPRVNPPCWFILAILPSWLLYPLVAAPLHFLEQGARYRFGLLIGLLLSLTLAQFLTVWVSWIGICNWVGDFSKGKVPGGYSLPDGTDVAAFVKNMGSGPTLQWFGWDSHYHPITLMSEFLIGALTAAAARRHAPPATKGEEKPLLPPAPSMAKLLTWDGASQWVVDNRLGLFADFCVASVILLTVLVPRPVTYSETCPASSDVGWLGGATGGYWWDPFAVAMQPLICLLTCGFLYSTMLVKSASERGVLSWYLAACSGWAPYCLAVYLWQIPFSHFFSAGDKVVDVMVPLMFFALFVFSAMYTELIEKRVVQLVRHACGKAGELAAGKSSTVGEVTVTEPLTSKA